MEKTVGEIAQRQFWSVAPDDTIEAIAQEMVTRHLTWTPVLEGGTLMGVVSAWDLLHMRASGLAGDTPAWRACTYKPLTVAPDTPVSEAARLMREAHVHHLLVMTPDRKVVGIVSPLDLLSEQARPPVG
ncbi:MAG: CBS domain-containing protein [Pseudomonadota bacterium]